MFLFMGVGAIKTTTKFQGSSAYGWWVINDSCTSTDVSFYPQKVKLLCKAKVNPSVQRWKMWASTITFGIVAMENRWWSVPNYHRRKCWHYSHPDVVMSNHNGGFASHRVCLWQAWLDVGQSCDSLDWCHLERVQTVESYQGYIYIQNSSSRLIVKGCN